MCTCAWVFPPISCVFLSFFSIFYRTSVPISVPSETARLCSWATPVKGGAIPAGSNTKTISNSPSPIAKAVCGNRACVLLRENGYAEAWGANGEARRLHCRNYFKLKIISRGNCLLLLKPHAAYLYARKYTHCVRTCLLLNDVLHMLKE